MNRTLLKSKHSCEFSAAKKIYFLFMALLCCFSGYSANCVSATQVSANYTTQQVTFKLTWTGCNGTTHLNKAWCFVDFQPVDAAGNGGAWQRATISGTPVVVNGTYAAGNSNGFWVTGTNGQSATVTVKLGNAPGIFNWCAIATDYPPQATFTSPTVVKFSGTLPFVLSSGVSVTTSAKTYTPAAAFTSFTDKTNAPGTINCGSAVTTPALTGGGSVCATATLSVTNSQVGVSYQLYNGTTAGESKDGTGGAISFTPVGAGSYKVVGRNNYYTACAATSTVQTVTLYPIVTQSNPAVATICYNATNTFSLAAATGGDGNYTYLWQQSGNNSTWTNATGTRTNAAYTTPALTANMYYRRVVTSCGNSATSTAALVTVRANFTTGTIDSTGQTVTAGETPGAIGSTVAASGGGGTISYQWYKDGVAISGATAANYTPPASMTAALGTYTYTRRAKDNTCNTTLTQSTGSWVLKVTCPYTGSDLLMDATHVCQQRASGAKNWEAWIKDARDNELYRIVRMPDNKWWLAQNVKYAATGSAVSGCTKDECGRAYTPTQMNGAWGGSSGWGSNIQGICPSGWVVPILSDWDNFITAIGSTKAERIRPYNSTCSPKSDYYGWASKVGVWQGSSTYDTAASHFNYNPPETYNSGYGLAIDRYWCQGSSCNGVLYNHVIGEGGCEDISNSSVRCWRY